MARHSKWHQIRLKKGALDKKRGKIFTKHARLITSAAAFGGGDPGLNPSLRAAIDNAKAANLPNDNIDRAVKKGTGEGKNAVQFHEVVYEAFAPGGVALIIETLTDNKNRTAQHVRTIIEKHGGNLGTPGSTAFLFKKQGVIRLKRGDEAELASIEAGAEDTEPDGDDLMVYTAPNNFHKMRQALKGSDFEILDSEIAYIPENEVVISDTNKLQNLEALIDALEENDDVINVWTNAKVDI